MSVMLTIVTRSSIEAYARDRSRDFRDEVPEAIISDDPLARQVFARARAKLEPPRSNSMTTPT